MRDYELTIYREYGGVDKIIVNAESPQQAFEMAQSVAGADSYDLVPVHHRDRETVH